MLQAYRSDMPMPVTTKLWVQEEAHEAGTQRKLAERAALLYQLQDGLDGIVSACRLPGTASLGSIMPKALIANTTASVMVHEGVCTSLDEESWLQELLRRVISWPSRQTLQLRRLYDLRNPTAIQAFLERYPALVDVLVEAYPYLQRHFDVSPPVPLELVQDAEAADRATLFAFIPTTLPVVEARARMYSFDDAWFLDQLDRVGSLLNFNLEFR